MRIASNNLLSKSKCKSLAWLACISGLTLSLAYQASALKLTPVADGFASPIFMSSIEAPDSGEQWIVVDQIGIIYRIDPKQGKKSIFLDLRSKLSSLNQGAFDERGALGFAAHPEFAKNGRFFVYYSAPLREGAPENWNHTSRVSEFSAAAGKGLQADLSSEKIILEVDEPQFNHNSGSLAFGPDGYLYISLGDGGAGNDEGLGHTAETGNAQDTSNLLGSILRIDVNGKAPYAIPEDNPFVGKAGRDEIYAYGLRNIWRMTFDQGGEHQLFAADVGQNHFEEVNIIQKGGNYGWKIREGRHCFHPTIIPENDDCPKVAEDGTPLIDPILEYMSVKKAPKNDKSAYGVCIVGGAVYRGSAIPKMEGCYVFADWSKDWGRGSGILLVACPPEKTGQDSWLSKPLGVGTGKDGLMDSYITGIGQDASGEVYVLTNDTNRLFGDSGKIFRIDPN
jgi:glucose/arabinose dehydrogenase